MVNHPDSTEKLSNQSETKLNLDRESNFRVGAHQRISFFDSTLEDLRSSIEALGHDRFRAAQIYKWIYVFGKTDFEEMWNIPKKLRHEYAEIFKITLPEVVTERQSNDGSYKILQRMSDGSAIETVLMRHEDYFTICVSSQVGCAMGCKFCMTATMGLKRNLTAGEIVGQVYNGIRFLEKKTSLRLRNIVYMGMGEPFHNYANMVRSLEILQEKEGFDFSGRRVTVSTSGLIPNVKRFLTEVKTTNLAISLNAINQETRKKLMPISGKYPLEELLKTCKELSPTMKRRITFEYILLKGVNDSLRDAGDLVRILNGIKAKVNLIPYNQNSGLGFERSDQRTIETFQRYLLNKGLLATVRYSKGQDISAACGQLALEKRQT